MELLQQYDEAMFEFSRSNYDAAIEQLRAILRRQPAHFDAQLALGMSLYRQGELEQAIVEGHKAEQLKPREQLAHTNLSLFYMKAGDKVKAEHHGLQARIASWSDGSAPKPGETADSELQMARPKAAPVSVTGKKKLPDMPWKKNKKL